MAEIAGSNPSPSTIKKARKALAGGHSRDITKNPFCSFLPLFRLFLAFFSTKSAQSKFPHTQITELTKVNAYQRSGKIYER